MAVARLLRTLTLAVVAVIVVGIILVVVSANPHNVVVSDIHDAGRWLVAPFHNVFSVKGKWNTVLNWGLAALVYLLVGELLSHLAARAATPRGRFGRARPVV
jgi:hypothetical protein